jgi:hypothetical protein
MCPWCEGETKDTYICQYDFTKDPPELQEVKQVECLHCHYIGKEYKSEPDSKDLLKGVTK